MPNIHSRRPDSHPIFAAAYFEQVQDERDALAARLAEIEAQTISSLKKLIYLTKMQLRWARKFNRQHRKAVRAGHRAHVGDQPRIAAPRSRDADETHAGEHIAAASSPAHISMFSGDMKNKSASWLREALAILDLDTKGTKEVLRRRILDHCDNERSLANTSRMLRDSGVRADDAAELEDAENVPPCRAPVEPIAGPSDIQS